MRVSFAHIIIFGIVIISSMDRDATCETSPLMTVATSVQFLLALTLIGGIRRLWKRIIPSSEQKSSERGMRSIYGRCVSS